MKIYTVYWGRSERAKGWPMGRTDDVQHLRAIIEGLQADTSTGWLAVEVEASTWKGKYKGDCVKNYTLATPVTRILRNLRDREILRAAEIIMSGEVEEFLAIKKRWGIKNVISQVDYEGGKFVIYK